MPAWCQHFDFSLDQQGWSLTWPDRPNYGTYEIGTGWKTRRINNADRLYLWKSFSQLTRVTWIAFTYTATGTTPPNALLTLGHHNGAFLNTKYGPAGVDGNSHEYSWTGSMDVDAIGFHIILTPGTGHILSAEVEGEGINPFVPSVSLVDSSQAPDQTAYIYRAPITGNPSSEDLEVNNSVRPLEIDLYAIDPINRHLWVHKKDEPPNWWLKVTANDRTSGTVLKPQGCYWSEDSNYTDNDRIITAPTALGNFRLPLSDILRIISNGVSNATSDYPLGNLSWNTFSTPQLFASWPLNLGDICSNSVMTIDTLGINANNTSYPCDLHNGVDFYVSDVAEPDDLPIIDVKSVDEGIVVGIGRGSNTVTSHAMWGAANQQFGGQISDGWSVIVRYGHLFVLYGHLYTLSSSVYVGKLVETGETIGQLGLFNTRHLHLEIHSYGEAIDVPEGSNIHNTGILPLNVSASDIVAPYIYDVTQFLPNPPSYNPSDNNNLSFHELVNALSITGNEAQVTMQLQSTCGQTYRTLDPAQSSLLGTVNVSGYMYRGYRAYPSCNENIVSPFEVTQI